MAQTLRIDLTINDQASPFLRTLFADQVPFATSRAINRTALDFQKAQRSRLHAIFTLRRVRWAEQSIKIKPFATKRSPEARISIDPPGGGRTKADILGKFETETRKGPFRGRSVAVPTEHVPRTGAGVIRKGWRPAELFADARQHGVGKVFSRKGNVYKGARGTFLIRRPGGKGVILQRHGGMAATTGHDPNVRPLYFLVPYVRITPELEFVETAKKTIERRWPENFREAFDRALRTAR